MRYSPRVSYFHERGIGRPRGVTWSTAWRSLPTTMRCAMRWRPWVEGRRRPPRGGRVHEPGLTSTTDRRNVHVPADLAVGTAGLRPVHLSTGPQGKAGSSAECVRAGAALGLLGIVVGG